MAVHSDGTPTNLEVQREEQGGYTTVGTLASPQLRRKAANVSFLRGTEHWVSISE